jgi:fucose 4-O-acetylase-like acetyltransferase
MKTYYYRLDAIKFFCIIAVVLIHVTGFLPSNGLATMSNYYVYRYLLDIAVPFFFAASGFFISSKTGTEYIGKYAKKIFIMYIAFSSFYIITNVFFYFY